MPSKNVDRGEKHTRSSRLSLLELSLPPAYCMQSRSYEYPLVRPCPAQTLRGSTGIFIPIGLITATKQTVEHDTTPAPLENQRVN